MATYIVRRLLLMIPTLIGMTFLLFLLISLAPGDFRGAMSVSGGGQMEGASRATQLAYYEDRYGLNDPIVIQYGRWLGRLSPVKFGARDQRTSSGELIRTPREVREPALWKLFTDELPSAAREPVVLDDGLDAAARAREYRRAANSYARTRTTYLAATTRLETAAGRVLRERGLGGFVAEDGRLDRPTASGVKGRYFGERPIPDDAADALRADAEVAALFQTALATYGEALASREGVRALFDARPHDEAGIGLVPGVWLGAPDLGTSFSRSRPVGDLITDALPVTLLLNALAIPIIYCIAIPSGMLAAVRQGTWFDVASGAFFVALWSIPIVWACVLALGYLANEVTGFGWFPVIGLHSDNAESLRFLPATIDGRFHPGYILDTLWHCVLPVACLTYAGFAVLSKQTRAAMLDNFTADYVRTAKAKGVAEKDVILRHVFRNSLLPLITMFVTIFPAMLAGSVVVERVFSVPGMGSLLLDAIYLRDREVLLGNAAMIGVVNMLALLLADILYAIADPRVSYR